MALSDDLKKLKKLIFHTYTPRGCTAVPEEAEIKRMILDATEQIISTKDDSDESLVSQSNTVIAIGMIELHTRLINSSAKAAEELAKSTRQSAKRAKRYARIAALLLVAIGLMAWDTWRSNVEWRREQVPLLQTVASNTQGPSAVRIARWEALMHALVRNTEPPSTLPQTRQTELLSEVAKNTKPAPPTLATLHEKLLLELIRNTTSTAEVSADHTALLREIVKNTTPTPSTTSLKKTDPLNTPLP